jgi:hypothetical protein
MEEQNQSQETILHIHLRNGKETTFHGGLEELLKFVIAHDLAAHLDGAHVEREVRPWGQVQQQDEQQ